MNPADIDWAVLRGSMIVFAISLVFSVGALVGSHQFWSGIDTQFKRQKRELVSVRGKYDTIDEEQGIIEEYLPRYRTLEAQGLIGREHRLNWIETLRGVARELKIPQVRYAIETQGGYEPPFKVEGRAFAVFATEMRLQLGLLHELDLLRLLEAMDERASGAYTLRGCDLRRDGEALHRLPTESNVKAECRLQWLTVRLAGGRPS